MGPNEPPSPRPVPPVATRTPSSPEPGSTCPILGQQANCGKRRAQLCPGSPSGCQPEACAGEILDRGQAQALTSQLRSRLRSCQT